MWKEETVTNHFIIPINAHNVKKVELLKYIKIMEATPTCFGLQRNHHQGATTSTQLNIQAWCNVDTDVYIYTEPSL